MKRFFIIFLLLLGLALQADAGFRIKPPKIPKPHVPRRVRPISRPKPWRNRIRPYPPVITDVPNDQHDLVTVTQADSIAQVDSIAEADSVAAVDTIDSQLEAGQDLNVDDTDGFTLFLWGLGAIVLLLAAWFLYLMYKSGDL